MKITEEQLQIIQKYLRDDLSSADQKLFDTWSKEKAFREEVLDQAQIINAVELGRDQKLKETIRSWGQQGNSAPQGKELPMHPQRRHYLKYAAIFFLLLAAFFAFNHFFDSTKDPEQLFAEYYMKIPAEVGERGIEAGADDLFRTAMQQYQSKNYGTALESLAKMVPTPKVDLYKAICMLELKDYTGAASLFDKVSNTGTTQEKQNAEWYRLLIALKNSEKEQVDYSLGKIVGNTNHLFYKKAKELSGYLN